MDRHSHRQNILGTITFFLLTIFFSCGQRTGIHNDEKDDNVNTSPTQTENKQIDISYNDKGGKLFKQNCAACHSANTDKVFGGPGLLGVRDRLPSEKWFIDYTINCGKVFSSGDAYSAKLRDEYKDNRMTVFEGILTEEDAKEIYKFLTDSQPTITVP